MKNNKGFTLVELIVVIVILAILIGVTIGGIYMYVGQARRNVDINNASAIEKAMQGYVLENNNSNFKNLEPREYRFIYWKDEVPNSYFTGGGFELNITDYVFEEELKVDHAWTSLADYLTRTFPDGLPECKTGDAFYMRFDSSSHRTENYHSLDGITCGIVNDLDFKLDGVKYLSKTNLMDGDIVSR